MIINRNIKKIVLIFLFCLIYTFFGIHINKTVRKARLLLSPSVNSFSMDENLGFTKNDGVDISETFWADFYGSNDSNGYDITGKYTSKWYFSKSSVVSIFLSGYFGIDGLDFYVELENGKKLYCYKNIGQNWFEYKFSVPINQKFRIVAEDNFIGPFGWIGFSVPMYRQQKYIILADLLEIWDIPLYIFFSFIWFLPGYSLFLLLFKNNLCDACYINILAFVFQSIISLIFLYFSFLIGRKITYIVVAYFSVTIFYLFTNRKILWNIYSQYDFTFVVKIILLLSLLYAMIIFGYEMEPNFSTYLSYTRRFMATVDNEFPLQFAKNVFMENAAEDMFGWPATSRPPLLSAMFLMLSPFIPVRFWDKFYLIFSLVMQLSVWFTLEVCMDKYLCFSRKQKIFFRILFAFAPVIISNIVYSWPKFQSATFFMFMVLLIFKWYQKKRMSLFESFLFGIATVAALLSHGSIAYAVIGLALLLLFRGNTDKKNMLVIFIVFFVLYFPWIFIEKRLDSQCKGDILLRFYFAGTWENDGSSLSRTILSAYKNIGIKQWIANRIKNFLCLFPGKITENFFSNLYMNIKHRLLVNLGVNVFIFLNAILIKKQKIYSDFEKYLFYVFLLSLIVQNVLIFNGWECKVHQSPYSNMLFLFIFCAFFSKSLFNLGYWIAVSFNILPIFYIFFTKGHILRFGNGADIYFRIRGGEFVIFLLLLIGFLFFIFREDIRKYVKQKESQ